MFFEGRATTQEKQETERQKVVSEEDRRGKRRRNPLLEGSTPLRRDHHQHLQQDRLHSGLHLFINLSIKLLISMMKGQ